MPDPGDFLGQAAGGFAPLARVSPVPLRTGFEGLPLPNGPLGGAAGLAAPSLLGPTFHRLGLSPLGLGGEQNAYDLLRAQELAAAQGKAVRRAADADRAQTVRLAQGAAALAGLPFGAAERRLAETGAGVLAAASPVLTRLAPGTLDELGGATGSAAVLASRVFEAGRYRADPVSGKLGLSAGSAAAQADLLFSRLYADGTAARTAGLSAGTLGDLQAELTTRGLLPGGRPARDELLAALSPDAVGAAARRQGVAPDNGRFRPADLDKLLADPELSDKVRRVDAARVGRTLEGYSEAVAAVRDLFGANGRPDAPMAELIGGLEALTAGAVGKADPSALARSVRSTANLARQAGVSIEQALVLQQGAASQLRALGGSVLAAPGAAQEGLAFRGAYDALGLGRVADPRRSDVDTLTRQATGQAAEAAVSETALTLTAARKLAEVSPFRAGSDIARLVEAQSRGADTFTDAAGVTRRVALGRTELRRLVEAGGGDAGAFDQLLADPDYLAPDVTRFGADRSARRRQADEGFAYAAAGARDAAVGRFRGLGLDATRAGAAADAYGRAVADTLRRGEFATGSPEFARAAADRAAELLGPAATPEVKAALPGLAPVGLLGADQALRAAGRGTAADFAALNSDRATAARDQQRTRADLDSAAQAAFVTLTKPGSLLGRLTQAVRDADPADPDALATAIGKSLGGAGRGELARGLAGPLRELDRMRAEAGRLADQAAGATDPALRQDLTDRHARLVKEARDLAERLDRTVTSRIGPDAADGPARAAALAAGAQARGDAYALGAIGAAQGPNLEVTPAQQQAALAAARVTHTDPRFAADGFTDRERQAAAEVLARRTGRPAAEVLRELDPERVTADGAAELARARRRLTPLAPDETAVDEELKADPALNRPRAARLAAARLALRRLGTPDGDVRDALAGAADPAAALEALATRTADARRRDRAVELADGSPLPAAWRRYADALKAGHPAGTVWSDPESGEAFTPEKLAAEAFARQAASARGYRAALAAGHPAGTPWDDGRGTTWTGDRLARFDLLAAERAAANPALAGPEGATVRAALEEARARSETAVGQLASKGALDRYGPRAAALAEELGGAERDIARLADRFSGGDRGALLAGAFKGSDDPAAQAAVADARRLAEHVRTKLAGVTADAGWGDPAQADDLVAGPVSPAELDRHRRAFQLLAHSDPVQLQRLREAHADPQRRGELADEWQVPADELSAAGDLLGRLDDRQKQVEARVVDAPAAVRADLERTLLAGAVGTADDRAGLDRALLDPAARRRARQAADAATRVGGVDPLARARAYRDAVSRGGPDRDRALAALKAEDGLDGPGREAEWDRRRADYQRLLDLGLPDRFDPRGAGAVGRLREALERAEPPAGDGPAGQQAKAFPDRVKLDGTVKVDLVNNTVSFADAWLDTRGATVPT